MAEYSPISLFSVTASNSSWVWDFMSGMKPTIDANLYYDLFVDVMLGVGAIFEIPVMLFLLTLIHVASPAFLVRHSRYANSYHRDSGGGYYPNRRYL